MKQKRRAYYNEKWFEFSETVQRRDGYKCLKCGRKKGDVVLQTHHKQYKRGIEVWEYPLSDCITLCKGCHAEQHGITEPTDGWTLISIDDLGGLYGTCEKKGCGTDIRYEHLIYHPNCGYKVVGSSCVEFLTREDQYLSQEVLKVFKKICNLFRIQTGRQAIQKITRSIILQRIHIIKLEFMAKTIFIHIKLH